MKKILLINTLVCFSVGIIFAQTTATDFTTNDCNGVAHNLFNELDAGNVIVISWVMPCGPCETYSLPAYSAVQSFATSHPGRVHFYIADDYGTTACGTLNNFASNMPVSTIFSSSDVNMSDYGAYGMPKVVVLGGNDHTIYYNQNDSHITFPGAQSAISDALSAPLAIEQPINNKFEISSYPNPVNNVLNVSYTKIQSAIINFTIVDVLGQVVLKVEDNSSSSTEKLIKSINVSTLNDGNYFLRISSEIVAESIPFVVSH
ncbi:MAG: T9SS type A sorting domain-containing protein [Pelagibacterales bacterium]|nr:T9SS type A sorting domain-containing protein [Pelagibacterales bacterium]